MKTNRIVALLVLLLGATALLLVGCGGGGEEAAPEEADSQEPAGESMAGDYEDGIHFAQEDGFSERTGWKYMVTLEVEGGEIVSAEWNGAHRENGTDKVTRSESGEYGMVERGDAQWPWFEQAAKAEEYLLQTQDPTEINYTDEEGRTDSFSGATIHVVEFFTLAEEALSDGPEGYGMWQDGTYHAEADGFSEQGWKDQVDITVVSGRIVAAWWDPIAEDGGTNKKQRSMDGEYGMVENSDAQWPWHEQAIAAEEYLMEVQGPAAIELDDEGNADAISGASIHVNGLVEVAMKALEGAKR